VILFYITRSTLDKIFYYKIFIKNERKLLRKIINLKYDNWHVLLTTLIVQV